MTPAPYVTFSIPGHLDNDAVWTLKVVWEDGHVSVYQHDPRRDSQLFGANSVKQSTVVYFSRMQDSWREGMSQRSCKIVSMIISSCPMGSDSPSSTSPKT